MKIFESIQTCQSRFAGRPPFFKFGRLPRSNRKTVRSNISVTFQKTLVGRCQGRRRRIVRCRLERRGALGPPPRRSCCLESIHKPMGLVCQAQGDNTEKKKANILDTFKHDKAEDTLEFQRYTRLINESRLVFCCCSWLLVVTVVESDVRFEDRKIQMLFTFFFQLVCTCYVLPSSIANFNSPARQLLVDCTIINFRELPCICNSPFRWALKHEIWLVQS